MSDTAVKKSFSLQDDDLWNAVNDTEKAGFFEKVGKIDGKHDCNADTTEVHWRQLPFYQSIALVRLRDANWDPSHLCVY